MAAPCRQGQEASKPLGSDMRQVNRDCGQGGCAWGQRHRAWQRQHGPRGLHTLRCPCRRPSLPLHPSLPSTVSHTVPHFPLRSPPSLTAPSSPSVPRCPPPSRNVAPCTPRTPAPPRGLPAHLPGAARRLPRKTGCQRAPQLLTDPAQVTGKRPSKPPAPATSGDAQPASRAPARRSGGPHANAAAAVSPL